MITDVPSIQVSIYIVHMLLAFLFMIGRGLPWVTIALWIFQFSLRNRNFSIGDGGDDLMVLFLFLSIFLPLTGNDSKKAPTENTRFGKWWSALWGFVFVTQLCSVYFFSALKKDDPAWHTNFTANFLAIRLENMTTAFGHALLHFPTLLQISTAGVYTLELFGPWIYFIAYLIPHRISIPVRKTMCVLFMLLHVFILVTFRLWGFPLVAISIWIALWPWESESQPELLPEKPAQDKRIYSLLTIPVMIWITITNWNLIEIDSKFPIPEPMHFIGQQLSLWQSWGMFAPFPTLNNQHIKLMGVKKDFTETEVFHESEWHDNRHRVKLLLNMGTMDNMYVGGLAKYYCRKYPEFIKTRVDVHNSKINKDTFVVTEEDIPIWFQDCSYANESP